MPSVSIVIDVSGEAAGVPGQARTFAYSKIGAVAPTVTVSLATVTGITEYFWEIVDKPSGSTAVLSDSTAAAPTFSATATAAGSYLIRCTINGGQTSGTNMLSFLTESAALRKLAARETLEFDLVRGWTESYNDVVDAVEGIVAGGGGGGTVSGFPHGVKNDTTGQILADISFTSGTRTFTATPVTGGIIYAYIDGVEKNLVGAQSVILPDSSDRYYIYIDSTPSLQYTSTWNDSLLRGNCLLAIVDMLASGTATGDLEVETLVHDMRFLWHAPDSERIRYWYTGASLASKPVHSAYNVVPKVMDVVPTWSTPANTNIQIGYSGGTIYNLDVPVAMSTDDKPAEMSTVLPKDGGETSVRLYRYTSTQYPVRPYGGVVSNRLSYVNWSGLSWQELEVPEGKFVNYHIIAVGSVTSGTQVVSLVGKGYYDSALEAREGAQAELDAYYLHQLIPTGVLMGTLTYECQSAFYSSGLCDRACRIVNAISDEDFIDWTLGATKSEGSTSTVFTPILDSNTGFSITPDLVTSEIMSVSNVVHTYDLPSGATVKPGFTVKFFQLDLGSTVRIIPFAGDTIMMSGDFSPTSAGIESTEVAAACILQSVGVSIWLATVVAGEWHEYGTASNSLQSRGHIDGATLDNVATFDTLGNVKDSGVAITGVGGDSLDSAYDFGGAGAGRAITVDNGALALTCVSSTGLHILGNEDKSQRLIIENGSSDVVVAVEDTGHTAIRYTGSTPSVTLPVFQVSQSDSSTAANVVALTQTYSHSGYADPVNCANLDLSTVAGQEAIIRSVGALALHTDVDSAAWSGVPGIRVIHQNAGSNISADVRVQAITTAGSQDSYALLNSKSEGGNADLDLLAQSNGTVADIAKVQISALTTATARKQIFIGSSSNSEEVKIVSGDGRNPGTPANGWDCSGSDLDFLCDQSISIKSTVDSGAGDLALLIEASTESAATGDAYIHLNARSISGTGEIRFTDEGNDSSSWTQGYILLSDGTSTEWDAFETKYGEVSLMAALITGGSGLSTTVNTSTYSVVLTDDTVLVTYTTTGVCTITVPSALIAVDGFEVTIKDAGFNAGVNKIVIDTGTAELIDGQTSAEITGNGESITLYSDGSDLYVK